MIGVFVIFFLGFISQAEGVMSHSAQTKRMACVLVKHSTQIMNQGEKVLQLSPAMKKKAKTLARKILDEQKSLHKVVKEALHHSPEDIYVLRLLCAQKNTFTKPRIKPVTPQETWMPQERQKGRGRRP
ncbi:hypothetical protein [Candidatus Hepatobacter penaei]|uniref:hypothetical protein n=1 Tax=Candidatus Hepatobacter penaei TaxID=1274402 RepID=UPI0012E07D74|nr:hypothetical protein [Candidatus Hepatobacter penaei]